MQFLQLRQMVTAEEEKGGKSHFDDSQTVLRIKVQVKVAIKRQKSALYVVRVRVALSIPTGGVVTLIVSVSCTC